MAGVVLKADKDQLLWLHIFQQNSHEMLKKADRLKMTQVEVVALKRLISQMDAIVVAVQRGLPLSGPDLIVGRFHISLADLNIAARKRQISWETMRTAGAKLRAWRDRELAVRKVAA